MIIKPAVEITSIDEKQAKVERKIFRRDKKDETSQYAENKIDCNKMETHCYGLNRHIRISKYRRK